MRAARSLVRAALALVLVVAPRSAGAQSERPRAARDTTCGYRECALSIVPAWNGLAVVRGAAGPRVANLYFLWPRDITPVLRGHDPQIAGADSAAAQARRALRLRRLGAALTDGGVVAVAVAAVGALQAGRLRRGDALAIGGGSAALALSVPLQFAADGALSRAVWWHNLRFAP